MNTAIFFTSLITLSGCNLDRLGSASADFSSYAPNATYESLSFGTYKRVEIKPDNSFVRYEAYGPDGGPATEHCYVEGQWSLVSGIDSPDTGNALSLTSAAVNGQPISEQLYPVSQLSDVELVIYFEGNRTDLVVGDPIAGYSDLNSTSGLSLVTTCGPQ